MSKCQCSRDFPEPPFAMLSGKTSRLIRIARKVRVRVSLHPSPASLSSSGALRTVYQHTTPGTRPGKPTQQEWSFTEDPTVFSLSCSAQSRSPSEELLQHIEFRVITFPTNSAVNHCWIAKRKGSSCVAVPVFVVFIPSVCV